MTEGHEVIFRVYIISTRWLPTSTHNIQILRFMKHILPKHQRQKFSKECSLDSNLTIMKPYGKTSLSHWSNTSLNSAALFYSIKYWKYFNETLQYWNHTVHTSYYCKVLRYYSIKTVQYWHFTVLRQQITVLKQYNTEIMQHQNYNTDIFTVLKLYTDIWDYKGLKYYSIKTLQF